MNLTVWKRYGFAWVTGALFLFTLVGHWLAGWFEYVQDQQAHGQAIEFAPYAVQMLRGTLENWQSEFLQLFSFVTLAAILIHRGSAESKDSDEQVQAALKRIEQRLDELAPRKT